MNYENELNFFRDILEKCHIHTSMLSSGDNISETLDAPLESIVGYFSKSDRPVKNILGNIESRTKYVLCNEAKLKYICVALPILSEKNLLFIGPYLSSALSSNNIFEIAEKAGLAPGTQSILRELY